MDNLIIEKARIGFKNFAGVEGPYNPPGKRSFCVFFKDPEEAHKLGALGWNIKYLTPKKPDEADELIPYIQVSVSYGKVPPKIIMISGSNRVKTQLKEEQLELLDYAEIENVDLVIRPYHWEVNKKQGVKAYLKTMYITLRVDEFEEKYESLSTTTASMSEEEMPF